MIAKELRYYECIKYDSESEYGTPVLNDKFIRFVRIAIYPTSTSVQDSVLYKSAEYIGLTPEAGIDDKYVIQYGEKRLKVLYSIDNGRYKQLFMECIK